MSGLETVKDCAITELQVAERLGVSVLTVRAWRRRGQGPAYLKLGRAVRYRVVDVEAYLERCTVTHLTT